MHALCVPNLLPADASYSVTCVANRSAWKAVEWVLIRGLVVIEGYDMYVTVFYVMAGVIFGTLALTAWVALVLKGSDSVNPWLKRCALLVAGARVAHHHAFYRPACGSPQRF